MAQKPDLTSRSKKLLWPVALVLFVLGGILVAQGFIDTGKLRDRMIQTVKEQTGKDLNIKGKVTISLLPMPVVYFPGVEIRDDANKDAPGPSATAELLRVGLSPTTLFSDHPVITSVQLLSPVLEIERSDDNEIHWNWMTSKLMRDLSGGIQQSPSFNLELVNGRIIYHNAVADRVIAVEDINAKGGTGSGVLNGGLTIAGRVARFQLKREGAFDAEKKSVPVTLSIFADDNNRMDWKGDLGMTGDEPHFGASFEMKTDDLNRWMTQGYSPVAKQASDTVTNEMTEAKPQQAPVLPFKLKGNWQQIGLEVRIESVELQGLNSSGTGNINFHWDKSLTFASEINFNAFDYNQWQILGSQFAPYFTKPAQNLTQIYNDAGIDAEPQLPKDMNIVMNLSAQQFFIGSQNWKNVQLMSKLEDGIITVDKFNADLPGDATFSLFGVVSESSSRMLRFEGSMDAKGKSLKNLLTVFDDSAAELSEAGLGEFYIRSNIFVSPEQVRLSEADVKITDLHLNGGLVAYFDANPRVEADVKLKDINFDYFRDQWRKKAKSDENKKPDFFLKFDKSLSFNWLRKLKTTVDFKVNVDKFTLFDREGSAASFRLFAKQGELGIYNVYLTYPTETTQAAIKLDVTKDQPFLNVLLNTSELDTSYFAIEPSKAKPKPVIAEAPSENALPAPQAPALAPAASAAAVVPPAAASAASAVATAGAAKTTATSVKMQPQADTGVSTTDTAAPSGTPPEMEALDDKVKAKPAAPVFEKKRWPEELIDPSWMDGISAQLDLSVGTLTHEDKLFSNVKMRARMENSVLTVSGLSFNYWGGKIDMTGSVYGGTVPGVSLGFTIYNGDLKEMLTELLGRKNISGRVSISGTLATSGVNFLSWMSQSEMKLVLAGRGVNVDGINMQGVLDAVNVSRTASDVLNNVNLALVNGSTEFSVDGNINVHNGVVRTPGVTLHTGNITGDLTGEVRLVPWTMALSTMYQFPEMTSETTPTMVIQSSGSIDHPEMATDTASLEAYVAKRIVGR